MNRTLPIMLALLSLSPRPATADQRVCAPGEAWPCGLQIEEVGLSEVPSVFHLQARISQAQLPVGEGLFGKVFVQVKQGNTALCTQAFTDVRVTAGVMNLEIGPGLSCNMSQVFSENTGLSLHVCPGTLATCLPAIPIASAGYVVKASFASKADRAWRVEHVAQATYAHRVAVDGAVHDRKTIGTGYFEFTTPTPSEAQGVYPGAAFDAYRNGGFIRWTPTRNRGARSLHLAARAYKGALSPLESLTLAASETRITGRVTVRPPAGVNPGLEVTAAGLHVAGHTELGGLLTTSRELSVGSGGVAIAAGALLLTGDASSTGDVTAAGAISVSAGGLHGGADSVVSGALTVPGGILSTSGGLSVAGDAVFGGALTAVGASSIGSTLDVAGSVTFKGPVIFEVGHSEPDVGPDARYVVATGESRDLSFGGLVTTASSLALNADLQLGGATISGWRVPTDAAPPACLPTLNGRVHLSTDNATVQVCAQGEYRPLTYRVCGDGLQVPGEACDDGNPTSGDGCSPTCEQE